MYSKFFESLSREGKTLVLEAMERLAPNYDEESGMVCYGRRGRKAPGARPSMYYALGLMLLNEEGCAEKTEKICRGVIDMQINAPKEIFHGVYHHYGQPVPKEGVMDYERLGLYGRYFTDLFYEKTVNAFRRNLLKDDRFKDQALEIEGLLNRAVVSEFPIVWTTYEPNSREFILMCFTMLLEHFSDKLSPACIKAIEDSSRIALEGAIMRSKSNFNPLNTNIQCMHVFTVDYFGRYFKKPEYCAYALQYAEEMTAKYLKYHSAAEFNSPTYCSVDLSTLGFWRRYGSCDRLKELGEILESGLWRDLMEFYNPAMMNISGPYSRAYELEMSKHTSYHAMMYWAMGEEKFPWHPFTAESTSNPLLVFGGVNMPEDAKEAVFAPKEDYVIYHRFRELSERGEPGNNDALCTATGWITPDLMIGAMAGSENPSHQLHPLVLFWRGEKGLGTIKVLRRTRAPEHKMNHLHTVYFNAKADRTHMEMDVDIAVNRDIEVFFEIEYPGIRDAAEITPELWKLPGLNLKMASKGPEMFVEKDCEVWGAEPGNVIRVCYLGEVDKPETMKMHFDMDVELVK